MRELDHPKKEDGGSRRRIPIVGQIVEVSSHPNADRLYIAKVNVGSREPVSVIFGGSRELEPGDLVPIALPGARLPDGDKVRARKYRGINSNGVLLSSDELGWTINGPDEVVVLATVSYHIGDPIRV